MHLMTATRPDIAYAVGYVSRFMENPQEEHWVAVKRIFRYLQGTKTHGICFKPGNKIDFRGYSDADWAGDLADRKSTSGYTFMLMSCACELGAAEAVKRVAVYERSGVYCAQSGDPRGQVDSSPAVRDPGSCQRDGPRAHDPRRQPVVHQDDEEPGEPRPAQAHRHQVPPHPRRSEAR
ncbi:hypothetical protein Pcac1_g28958 [Phytophthora cactorum]|nr:hypothetical protein Pcac1_g28958 [Phytophthora cactorum]